MPPVDPSMVAADEDGQVMDEPSRWLLLDMGNSRIKTALADAGAESVVLSAIGSADLHDMESLLRRHADRVQRVVLASVAPEAQTLAVVQKSETLLGVTPELAVVQPNYQGLQVAYREPQRLGVDRWLAMLAAWRQWRTALLVVDAGSALTLDWIDADGRHQGGWICPGLAGIGAGLHAAAPALPRVPSPVTTAAAFGQDTGDAIASGRLAMLSGVLLAARHLIDQRPGDAPKIVITGGDAEAIIRFSGVQARHQPDLVLHGLLMYARGIRKDD